MSGTNILLDRLTRLAPAATVTGAPGSHRIDLFFTVPDLGQMGQPNLWHRYWLERDGGWRPRGGWRQRGGSWTSAVSATAHTGGRVDVFGLAGRSGSLYQATGTADALDGPGEWPRVSHGKPDGWTPFSSPAALALGPSSTIVGMRAIRHVNGRPVRALYFRQLKASGGIPTSDEDPWQWTRRLSRMWPDYNTRIQTALTIASRQPGALDIFGVSRRYLLEHTWIDPSGDNIGWGAFDELGEGFLTSSPTAAVWPNNSNPAASSLHVACCYGPLGPLPGAISLKSWLGRHWTKQKLIFINGDHGRGICGPPVMVSWGKPRLDLFFLSSSREGYGITHGFSDNGGRDWDFSEVLPLNLT